MNKYVMIILGIIAVGLVTTSLVAVVKYGGLISPEEKPTIAQQLQECLPKSDQKSHEQCQRLLASITDFVSCERAGLAVMESYPRRCALPDGRTFTEVPNPPVSPAQTTLTGTYTCLPHKDTGGPVTLECALGLKTVEGTYVALATERLSEADRLRLGEGETVTVTGTLVPLEQISSDIWHRYDIIGIMNVQTLSP